MKIKIQGMDARNIGGKRMHSCLDLVRGDYDQAWSPRTPTKYCELKVS